MEEFFLKLIDMSLSASVLALVVIVIRTVFRKIPKTWVCLMWALVAVRLLIPVSIRSPFSLMPFSSPFSSSYEEMVLGETQEERQEETTEATQTTNQRQESTQYPDNTASKTQTVSAEGQAEEISTGKAEAFLAISSVDFSSLIPVFFLIWAAGVIGMGIYALIICLSLRKVLQEAMRVDEKVWIADGIHTSFIWGIFRPKIVLPSSPPEEDLGYVKHHEQMHLKRKDHLWKPLSYLLLSVYWFSPILWVAFVIFGWDLESACDEMSIGNHNLAYKKGYTHALAHCQVIKRRQVIYPLAFGECHIKRRIKAILRFRKPTVLWTVLTVAICLVITGCFLTDPVREEGPAAEAQDQSDGNISAAEESSQGTVITVIEEETSTELSQAEEMSESEEDSETISDSVEESVTVSYEEYFDEIGFIQENVETHRLFATLISSIGKSRIDTLKTLGITADDLYEVGEPNMEFAISGYYWEVEDTAFTIQLIFSRENSSLAMFKLGRSGENLEEGSELALKIYDIFCQEFGEPMPDQGVENILNHFSDPADYYREGGSSVLSQQWIVPKENYVLNFGLWSDGSIGISVKKYG